MKIIFSEQIIPDSKYKIFPFPIHKGSRLFIKRETLKVEQNKNESSKNKST